MKNIILGILAKISVMDAETKKLSVRVEAQSLMLSALILSAGKNEGLAGVTDNVSRAINAILEAASDADRADAELLLAEFYDMLTVARGIGQAETDIDPDALTPASEKN